MKRKNTPDNAHFTPSWSNVLGLSQPADRKWGQVRAAQINGVRKLAIARLLFNIAGVGACAVAVREHAKTVPLVAWLVVSIVVFLAAARGKLSERSWEIQTATPAETHRETVWSTLGAICWGAAPLLFSPGLATQPQLVIWGVLYGAMAAAALTLYVAPLATSFYLLVTGSCLTLAMYSEHMLWAAVVAAVYTTGLIIGTLRAGRSFVENAAAGLALVEKTEAVSLLLREFDDSGGDWMWQTDASKCLTHVSARFAVALGAESASIEAKPLLQILAGDNWETGKFDAGLHELAEKLKTRESFSDLVLPLTINGERHWWEMSGTPSFDERGTFQGFRGVGSDVTSERRSADKISHMARFDTLTGLPNRVQLTEAMGRAMEESDRWRTKCAFMMIDLDRFKAVNDTLGHPVGDRLLQRVAERLASLMSDKEMCGRLGGDEFAVVVFDGNDPNRLQTLARRIIDTLSVPYEIDGNTLYIGASVGTAVGPRDGRTVETLLRSADLALYRSKDQGGGAVNSYEPQLHVHAEERRVLEIALRKALEKNELSLHYQPVVSVDGHRVESFEALVRWTNPELGVISPARFIPIAEDARLINPIGDWVLRTACREAMNWPEQVRVAVNVSAEQLTQPNFVATVVSALSQSGLPARRLELEVTESAFLREGTTALQALDQILALGIRLSLDDFGTGYSSLGYLSKTKFSTIKVDRSFVQGAAKNTPEAVAIIRAVVALADSLGMSTTAEGVETEAELHMIAKLGCRKIQGYLFGRPMPAEDARRLFDPNRAVA